MTGHNSSSCCNYPIQELHLYLFNTFKECIRYNVTHYGLNNYQEKRNHINNINNLSLSEIKLLAKKFGIKTTFNRAILYQHVTDIYVRLVERELNMDNTFIQEINERNNLLRIQEIDNNLRDNINVALTLLQTNMNLLSGHDLENYISQLGTYIHFTSSGIHVELPELPRNINSNNLKFNISIIKQTLNNNDINIHYTNTNDCPICMEKISFENSVSTNCNHTFCSHCICNYIKTCNSISLPRCSLCRQNTTAYIVTSQNSLEIINNVLN
jgi:hypothetical protein